MLELNNEWGRFRVEMSPDPTARLSLWCSLIGGLFLGMSMLGANQPCMQRTCTLKNLNMARWSAFVGSSAMAIFIFLSTTVGFVIFAYYTSLGCDPVQSGQVSSGNQMLPFYIMDVLAYPGLPGLLFSSLFSAALSSLSSSINSMSAVMWKDILEPYFNHWTESRKTKFNKLLTFIFGLCCLGSSFVMLFVGGSLVAIAASVLGAVLGPLLGVFFLAALVPFSNWKGALTGGIISACLNLWLLFGMVATGAQATRLPAPTYGCSAGGAMNETLIGNYTSTDSASMTTTALFLSNSTMATESEPSSSGGFLLWMYSISFIWYPFIGVIVTMVIGVLVSLCTGYTRTEDIDPKLVASYVYCGTEEDETKYEPVKIKEIDPMDEKVVPVDEKVVVVD